MKDKKDEHPVVDWDDLSQEDKKKAEQLLEELNEIMDKYIGGNDEALPPEKE